MPAYSFKRRFVDPIKAGLGTYEPILGLQPAIVRPKRQTIRAIGKRRHARPGEVIQLYCAMRTKQCFKIGEGRCVSSEPIRIDFEYQYVPDYIPGRIEWGDPFHVCQGKENLDRFATQDGFSDWAEMKDFWMEEHGLGEFRGMLIKWEPL